MEADPNRVEAPAEEVVFVLRLRASSAGWWGQVKRLDDGSLRHIISQPELHALLDADWLLARAGHCEPCEPNDQDVGDPDAS